MRKKGTRIGAVLLAAMILTAGCGGTAEEQQPAESGQAEVSVEAEETEPSEESTDSASEEETEETVPEIAEETETDPFALYEPHEEKVTLMLYMTGSDLESSAGAATSDMEEIAQSGIDLDKVDLLIFTGGAPLWHSEDPVIPTDENVLYRLTESGYEEVERMELLSMGDPANLTRFLAYVYENYPADSFDLILWNHGNGPVIGYGSDKQFKGDSLTLSEMREALEASPFGKDNKLALIGFDACLMSSAELMCVLGDYAQYMVASQETEPSFGWNYDFLQMCGKIRTDDLAREIVREYSAYCKDYFADKEFFQSDVTLAAVDLSYAGEMEEALNSLFSEAAGHVSGDYNKLAKARVNTHGFGRASTGSEYDLVDLENLMEQMAERYPQQTQAVRDVLDKAVLANDATVGESCGLSMFYPYYNKNYYKKSWKEEYEGLDAFPDYASYLSRYEQVWLGTDLKDLFNDALVLQPGADSETFTMQLTPEQAEQFASAQYYILRREGEGIYALVYASTDVTEKKGLLTANFDGKVIFFSDNYDEKDIPPTRMFDTVDGVTDYAIFGELNNGLSIIDENYESKEIRVQISVDKETDELTVKGIYSTEEEDEISTGKKEAIDPADWNQFNFYNITGRYLTRDEEGRILPYWNWPQGDWIVWHEMPIANGVHFTYEPLYDDGNEYYIMFEVSDVQNNIYSSELLPITLADAPAEQAAKAARELTWESGPQLAFIDEQGVEAGFRYRTDPVSGADQMLAYINAGDYPVHVDLDGLLINGNIWLGSNSVYLWAEAGETYVNDFRSLMETCRLAGIDRPDTLAFTLTMKRSDTDEYLIYKEPFVITFGEDLEPAVQRTAVLGARAEEQQLTDTESVSVQLLELGDLEKDSYHDPEINVSYKVTNHSEEEKDITLLGMSFNGVYLENSKSCIMEPGDVWYAKQTFSQEDIQELVSGLKWYEIEDRLQSVSEAAAVIKIGNSVATCPVELSEKGDQDSIEAQGAVIWEDDRICLRLDSFRQEESSEGIPTGIWEVWAENRTEDHLSVRFIRDGAEFWSSLTFFSIPPGGRSLVQVSAEPGEATEGLSVYLDTEGLTELEQVQTEVFTLPAQ